MFHEQAKVLVVLARWPDILPQELRSSILGRELPSAGFRILLRIL